MENDKYKCDMCGEVFKFVRSEEEAIQEKNNNFGNIPLSDCGIVCNFCYVKMFNN